MTKTPKITVITVVFNDAAGLRRTSASVLAQDYPDIEYLIIDGASQDNTREVLAELKNHSRVRVISEPDRGIYDAMNKGIRLATGDWLNFMNAGDCFYADNVLSRVFGEDYTDNTVIIAGDIVAVWKQELKISLRAAGAAGYHGIGMPCCHQAAFIRRTHHLKHFYQWDKYPISADCAAFMAMCKDGKGFQYVHQTIAWFDADGVSSRRCYDALKEMEKITGIKRPTLKAKFSQFANIFLGHTPKYFREMIQRQRLLRHGWVPFEKKN